MALELSEITQNLTQIEDTDTTLYDLTLEAQVQLLEFLKCLKDVEKGRAKGKGFGNCWKLNKKRDPKIYTHLELQFKNLADNFDLELNHEVRIKVKDRLNRYHIFKLDFYDPKTAINVEISPNWHKNYLIVERRDALRRRLLKSVGIRMLSISAYQKGKRCFIDVARAKRVIKTVLNAKTSPNSLDFYLKGVN